MDTIFDPVPSYFGEPVRTPEGTLNHRTMHSPVEYRTAFANNLGVPVTIAMRNGLKFVVPPEPSTYYKTFVIRVYITIKPSAYDSVMQALSAALAGQSKEMETLGEAVKCSFNGNAWNGGSVVLDYELTYEQLTKLGGSVYYHDVDFVVSLESVTAPIHHPHSEKGRAQQVVIESSLASKELHEHNKGEMGFGYAITMIDNHGVHGARYINISNKVYRITPSRDPSKRDGIFIVSNHSMSSKGGNGSFESRWYDFENAEEALGLYRTLDEALYGGDKSLAAKDSLLKAQAEVERMKAERQRVDELNAIEKARYDAEMRERDFKLEQEREAVAKERAEREYQETVRLRELKDHYEERSYVRKDTSEGLKFLPTLMVGLATLFGILKMTS
jgi:hypothetical protein